VQIQHTVAQKAVLVHPIADVIEMDVRELRSVVPNLLSPEGRR
jgi:hypothetical protein